jgi:beta-lactamase class A
MKYLIKTILIISLFACSNLLNGQDQLPIKSSVFVTAPLRNLVDNQLETRLYQELNANPTYARLIKEKRLAVGLVDLRNPYQARFARVNGNEMMYAASLPKIAILLSAMDAIEKGELEDSPANRELMHKMICYSNNQASTQLIDKLGYEKIESVLTDPRYELYDEEYGGGLWVGKRYAASGARHPDPIKGLSHAATVSQVCRFYYQLAMGKLVSRERSKEMLDLMDDPALHHKFVNSLDKLAPEATVYRKSGSWKTFHSDSMLVWGKDPSRRYILVALTEAENGEQIIRDMVIIAESVLDLQE